MSNQQILEENSRLTISDLLHTLCKLCHYTQQLMSNNFGLFWYL